MQFAVKAVELSDIPEKGTFGAMETPRSKYLGELLDAFIESDDNIWELSQDENGKSFKTATEAGKFGSSLGSKLRNHKKYAGISSCIRGKRVFVSKVKIIQGGNR